MTLELLLKDVPGIVEVRGNTNVEISDLCTDSRHVKDGDMFFCIPGLRMDAHDFAPDAVKKGAKALIVERFLPVECTQVLVKEVRASISHIAAAFYGHPAKGLKLIGLTGTKGKTTGSFLIKSILEHAGIKAGLIGTVCSMIGSEVIPSNLTTPDPIDFQKLLRHMADEGCTHVVMEVSAHALALHKLVGIKFAVVGFTNLSQDHFDFFGDMENYLRAKMRLFEEDMSEKIVINADDERVYEAMQKTGREFLTTGISKPSEMHANDIEVGERGCSFLLTYNKRFHVSIQMKLAGIFNVYNALMASGICASLGIAADSIREGLEDIRSVPGRIELLETETPYRVILDYAHSPDSLENILNAVRQTAKARMIALFGCGGDRDHEKRPIMGEIGGRLADYVILTSDNPRSENPYDILNAVEEGIRLTKCEYTVIENRREAIRYALKMAKTGDVVVLAGKGHETYQEIMGVKHPFDEKIVVKELLEEIAHETGY